jgi:hypothetical protein
VHVCHASDADIEGLANKEVLARLANQDRLYLAFYGDGLEYRFTIAVRPRSPPVQPGWNLVLLAQVSRAIFLVSWPSSEVRANRDSGSYRDAWGEVQPCIERRGGIEMRRGIRSSER